MFITVGILLVLFYCDGRKIWNPQQNVENENLAIVTRCLLKIAAKIDSVKLAEFTLIICNNIDYSQLLTICVDNHSYNMLQFLLEKGANINDISTILKRENFLKREHNYGFYEYKFDETSKIIISYLLAGSSGKL